MVSLWPWKEDTSAASFEKALSSLASKISKSSARHDKLLQSARRAKAMWTLYAVFAYILAALILTLVTGWRNWGAVEYTVVACGPVVIYAVRAGLTAYYNYRIASTQTHLEALNKERDATIAKLKAATKYDSTQQLLEKYGGGSGTPKSGSGDTPKRKSPRARKDGDQAEQRRMQATVVPPPTANIPRRLAAPPSSPSAPSTPNRAAGASGDPTAEFAPNAFSSAERPSPQQFQQQLQQSLPSPPPFNPSPFPIGSSSSLPPAPPPPPPSESHWYDRILDVLLGEDETQPRNRLALLCSSCRLVNGLAPPGTRRLEDVGRWRCGGCGAWNGVEREKRQDDGDGAEEVVGEGGHGVEERKLLAKMARKEREMEMRKDVTMKGTKANLETELDDEEEDYDDDDDDDDDDTHEFIEDENNTKTPTNPRRKAEKKDLKRGAGKKQVREDDEDENEDSESIEESRPDPKTEEDVASPPAKSTRSAKARSKGKKQ